MSFDRKIKCGSSEYLIKELSSEDGDSLQKLCERCADYYEIVEGRLPLKSAGYEI